MTDTPRTDVEQYIAVLTHQDDDEYVVPVDFARQLELELAAAQRQNHDHEMYVAGIARELAAAIASGLSGDGGG